MSDYTHILAAVDFMPDHRQVTERAGALARQNAARLTLVHVVEFLPMELADELVLPSDVELERQLVEVAEARLEAIAAELEGIQDIERRVEIGPTRHEILRIASEEAIDLIVIGSHGRHGIGRLLGSTANGILHGAPCDVLAVRIRG
ncbi:universal stress protein [Thiohalobacter sp. IOR34]|uniref:universal stress protein n=1 Tax=Thiohalobacter sp. IOR34 TaxID=3057176 RepID=UPI0025B1D1CE|nr:universal stress protein [Thiohalobacter sp. IOR34]WJW75904.1 universal stress protein [Thiohalobacter sp. IOR34]